ncbi:MAG: acetate--CoA ligase family protein [Proteobacteria bacterium]|nr:acetate--CoA ligase family protein [Burkholderiales bacterium]
MATFDRLFNPDGIAIVGASGDVTRFGGQTVRALNTSGYAGGIYPVNPKYPEIDGRKAYASVTAIDGPCDLAVIALPAAQVAGVVAECGRKGIGHAVVLGGGFREIGHEGERLEQDMLAAARAAGVRLIGPNCIGMVNVHAQVIAAFGSLTRPPKLQPGAVSVAVQSGGFGMSVVIQAAMAGVGVRYVVATGSESDITMPELLEHYVDDPGTKVIFAYIEGVASGRALIAALERALAAGKPVVVWKSGKTGQGARAAASHTANLTSTYAVYRAALRQCGAVEVFNAEQVVDFLVSQSAGEGAGSWPAAPSQARVPEGRQVAVVTNTGGSAVVFADAADQARLVIAPLGNATTTRLRELMPPLAAVNNPVDTTAGYPRPEHEASFRAAFETLLGDPDVHQLCVLFGTIMGPSFALGARVLAEATVKFDKPVFAVSAVPASISSEGHAFLSAAGIPLLTSPNRAAHTMGHLADFAQARQRQTERGAICANDVALPALPALPAGALSLDEFESKALLKAAGIPVTADVRIALDVALLSGGYANDTEGADAIPFPVALKLLSRDIAHKSDIGGVQLGIRDAAALADAAAAMVARARAHAPDARLGGLLACPMVEGGIEAIVGVVNDETFGPVVALGLGGIFAETLQDVVYRIAPFGLDEARSMIAELRAAGLFDGQRGRRPADRAALADVLVKVSALSWALRDRIAELDINPLIVRSEGGGVVAADALLVLRA